MWANSADQHGVAVDVQMLGGDRGRDIGPRAIHEGDRLCRGNMFEHQLETRQVGQQWPKDAFDEHGLPIEDVDVRLCYLAMHQQRHADCLHPFQHRIDSADISHAMRGTRGGMRGIELGRSKDAVGKSRRQFVSITVIRQISGHQRGKFHPFGQCRHNPPAVGERINHPHDRRRQVGHHDGPGKLPRGKGQHPLHYRAITQVKVPVIGSANGNACGRISHAAPLPQPPPL